MSSIKYESCQVFICGYVFETVCYMQQENARLPQVIAGIEQNSISAGLARFRNCAAACATATSPGRATAIGFPVPGSLQIELVAAAKAQRTGRANRHWLASDILDREKKEDRFAGQIHSLRERKAAVKLCGGADRYQHKCCCNKEDLTAPVYAHALLTETQKNS